jgi:hypothetical protein
VAAAVAHCFPQQLEMGAADRFGGVVTDALEELSGPDQVSEQERDASCDALSVSMEDDRPGAQPWSEPGEARLVGARNAGWVDWR